MHNERLDDDTGVASLPAAARRTIRMALMLALAPTAIAQAATPAAATNDVEPLSEVVVVGTRFQSRSVTDSPVPIDVLSAAEIRRNGYTDTSKILQSLVPSFNQPHPTTPDGNTHIRSATLRGLSPDQTLVLVNGKRLHTSAWVNVGGTVGRGAVSTDLNTIPPSAIERIEILRDGASAQYGSDAIAGVINIVLKEDTALEFSASGGSTQDGGGDTWDAALDGGLRVGDDGVVRASFQYRDRTAASRAEPDTRQMYFGRSPSGAAVALSAAYGSGIGLVPPGGAATTTLDPREATIDRANLWRFADSADLTDKTLLVNARLPLGPTGGTEFYAFAGHRDSDGSSNASLRRPGQPENVRAIYPDGFLPYVDTLSRDYSAGAGLRGSRGRWGWDLSSVYGDNEIEYRTHNTLNATLGAASPTRFYNGRLEAAQWTTNLDVKAPFDLGWRAPLQFAAGLELRHDFYQIGAGEPDSYRFGPVLVLDGPAAGTVPTIGSQGFAGIQPIDTVDTSRHSTSAWVDLEARPLESLVVAIAARAEDFSDFGSTTNGKLALRWEFSQGVSFRGSLSSGFHAPALAQQYYSSTSSRTLANAVTGVPEYVLVRTAPVGTVEAQGLGARDLRPEKSLNRTLGFTFERDGFSATADWYSIDIDDRIFLSSNFVDAAGQNTIRNFLASLGSPGVTSVRYFTNAGDTRTEGFDLSTRYRLDAGSAGRWTFSAAYNRNKTRLTRVAGTPQALINLGVRTPLFDVIERTRVEQGQPRDKVQLGVNWTVGPYNASLRGVRYGEIRQVALTNQPVANLALFAQGSTRFNSQPTESGVAGRVDVTQILEPKWVADIDLAAKINDRVTLAVGALNVFNTYPTRNIASTAAVAGADTFGAFPYSELSPFGWSGAHYYARVNVRF